MGAVQIIGLILRIVELLWAIIGIGCAGWLVDKGVEDDSLNFMLFTVITAMILTLFYLIVYCAAGLQKTFSGFIEFIVSFIWMIFFLAASAAMASDSHFKHCRLEWRGHGGCDTTSAAIAFGFMSWLLWIGSTIIALLDMLAGNGLPIFGVGKSQAPTGFHDGSAPVQNIQL